MNVLNKMNNKPNLEQYRQKYLNLVSVIEDLDNQRWVILDKYKAEKDNLPKDISHNTLWNKYEPVYTPINKRWQKACDDLQRLKLELAHEFSMWARDKPIYM